MGEKLINIGVANGTEKVGRGLRRQVNCVIGALKEKGVVSEGDDIYVNLRPDASVLAGKVGRRVEVKHVYRDGEKGALDTVDETYRID